MSVFHRAPFLRLLLPVALGCLGQHYFPLLGTGALLVVVLSSSVLLAVAGHRRWAWRHRGWWGAACQLYLVLAGALLLQLHRLELRPRFLGHHQASGSTYLATLTEPAEARTKSWKAEATVAVLQPNGHWLPMDGRIILYLQRHDSLSALPYGQRLLFTKPMERISGSPNPGAFDFGAYSAMQGVYFRCYLRHGAYRLLPARAGWSLQELLFESRSRIHQTLQEALAADARMAGLAEALITGYRADLDRDLVEQFANTGVVHVIAVSGMHLALLYGLLQVLLWPLRKAKGLRWMVPLVSLLVIWFFCLLTGAAPSAVRAAVMITVIIAGSLFSRQPNLVNSLAFAALLQLVINPYSLWNVGFQLSYAAVLSIGLFYQPLRMACWLPWRPARWLVDMLCVTLAAQILTLPLLLFHFHQMPTWFLLSNLLAVPLSTLLMYLLLLLLVVAAAGLPTAWLATACIWIGKALVASVAWVHSLPFGSISRVSVSVGQAALLFAIIAGLAIWLLQVKRRLLLPAAAGVVMLTAWFTLDRWWILQQQYTIVYHVPGMHALEEVRGSRSLFAGDSALLPDSFPARFHLMPSRIAAGAFPARQVALADQTSYLLQIGGHTLLLVPRPPRQWPQQMPAADWLIPGSGWKPQHLPMLRQLSIKGVLLDGATPFYRYTAWQTATDSLHLRLHNTATQGALRLADNRPG